MGGEEDVPPPCRRGSVEEASTSGGARSCSPPMDQVTKEVVELTAEWVAREGFAFERALLRSGCPHFEFLDAGRPQGGALHTYYRSRVLSKVRGQAGLSLAPQKGRAGAGPGERRAFLCRLDNLAPSKGEVFRMVTYFLDRPHDLVELVDAFCSRPLPQGASPALIVGNLYLASDLFHQFAKAGNRRCTKMLQDKLPGKFSACLNGAPESCGRIELEGLRHRITRVLQVWEREHMFSEGFLESFKV